MKLDTRYEDEILIVDIEGEVDLYNAPQIKDVVSKNVQDGFIKVIINLDGVTYIDSSGIGSLIFCRSLLKQNNGALCILKIHDSVKRVFELTKLTSIFSVFDDEMEALESFE
jgi:anti-sigma B factor antagonist